MTQICESDFSLVTIANANGGIFVFSYHALTLRVRQVVRNPQLLIQSCLDHHRATLSNLGAATRHYRRRVLANLQLALHLRLPAWPCPANVRRCAYCLLRRSSANLLRANAEFDYGFLSGLWSVLHQKSNFSHKRFHPRTDDFM